MHDCIRPGTDGDHRQSESSPEDIKGKGKQTNSKGREKKNQATYSFKWSTFPTEPIDEDELVEFLNEITDRAFDFAQSKLANAAQKLNHRFTARTDKNHAMPLSYEPDGEDMRPDFLLLPVEAFLDDFKTVDPRYLNFTATRLVGEAKNKDLAAGVEQVQRYARGLKRAQPWVHYVLAMAITRDKAVFMRGEGSGTEHLELILADGRGCIEFIRILLGLALAEDVDLGQNPDVELKNETRTCGVNNITHCSVASNIPSSATASRVTKTTNATEPIRVLSSDVLDAASDALPISSRTRSASAASNRSASVTSKALPGSSRIHNALLARCQPPPAASSASSKRVYSNIGEGGHQDGRKKKRKIDESVTTQEDRMVFFPLRVYRHTCLGILFTSSSIRGRGTTVFCVVDLSDEKSRLALKMSWQDLERIDDQVAVMKRLVDNPHRNVIVPTKTFNADRKGQTCTTLGAIRGFLEEQIQLVNVENRVLSVSVSELKRPVKYFWGVHDFVRGLHGALLGHEFLTSIGILHRDISENNIVLGLYPWQERGYLIDFDLAILQDAEETTQSSSTQSVGQLHQHAERTTTQPRWPDETKHVKGIRTGTFPYISFNVLMGERHTHFDDVESFFYVLLLFFFSYAGPLPKTELENAHDNGFVRPIGSGRLPHTRSWPKKYAVWADGEAEAVGHSKGFGIQNANGARYLDESAELRDCLNNNWPEDLHAPIRNLLWETLTAFGESTHRTGRRTEVSHTRFISILDKWLVTHAELEHEYSNCPDFKESKLG
ncbi:hypothetical protein EV363DRAFT_1367778 [Boletus edulis]|nr:hypothetical protein EV363DRAFT_1367778 [Boletus edulis]